MVHSWEQIWIRVLFLLVSSFPSLFLLITQNLPRKFLSSRESESVNRLAYKMWDNRSSRVSVDEQWALGVEPLKNLILLFFITRNTARMAKIFLAISCMLFASGECYFTTFYFCKFPDEFSSQFHCYNIILKVLTKLYPLPSSSQWVANIFEH